MNSPQGCPVLSVNAIWAFLEKYKILWGIFFIILGLLLNFLGSKLFKPAIFLLGMSAFVFISMLFFYTVFFDAKTQDYIGWIVLTISVLIGILVGVILAKLSKLGVAVLSGWGGVCLGLILWSAFLYKINSQAAFWIVMAIFALGFAFLSLILFDHALIISTSIVGSYAFVRGISFYAGRYPNEFTLISLIQKGLISQIDPMFYAYLGGIIVSIILGLIVQYKYRAQGKTE